MRASILHGMGFVATLALAGCGDGEVSFSTDSSGGAGVIASSTHLPLLQAMESAPLTVHYSGDRLVEQHYDIDGTPTGTIQRERVICDGQGNFFIELRDSLQPVLTQSEFQTVKLLRMARAGFAYRDRDFRIRDIDLFLQNYGVEVLPDTVVVAGHSCLDVRVERIANAARRYVLAVEPNTGLILRAREETLTGQLMSLVEFETLTLGPDVSQVDFHLGNEVQDLDLDDPALADIRYSIMTPGFVPAGFQLRSTEAVEDASDGSRWAKLSFGDGVEQLFFLHRGLTPRPGNAGAPVHAQAFGYDTAHVFQFGPWTLAQARLRGQSLLALGKCPEHELLLMLDSAAH